MAIRAARRVVALAMLAGPLGCIAEIKEERGYGAARPAPGATAETTQETRTAPALVRARAADGGSKIEVTVEEPTECRDVVATRDMVREVDVRRSFVNPQAQQIDLALSLLAGGGAGLVAYDGNGMWACSSGCAGQVGSAAGAYEWPLIALAAVPMAFVAYNALRVQDTRRLEPAEPERAAGPWTPCSARPMPREDVSVSMDGQELRATTGPDGTAMVDLSTLAPHAAGARVVVRHAGSDDVTLVLGDIPAAR